MSASPALRRPRSALSLSFLDVLSCGMGAMIFLFLLMGAMPRNADGGDAESRPSTSRNRVDMGKRGASQSVTRGPLEGLAVELEVVVPAGGSGCWRSVNCPGDENAGAIVYTTPIEHGVAHNALFPAGIRRGREVAFVMERPIEVQYVDVRAFLGGSFWPPNGVPRRVPVMRDDTVLWAVDARGWAVLPTSGTREPMVTE